MALLSTIKPDFAAIRAQFQAFLTAYPSWQDTLVSSTGQMIIDFVAAMATYDQFAVNRAAQEVFMETAIADSSVYSLVRLLGVKVSRKIAAQVTVLLESPNTANFYQIPAYSSFTIGSNNFYNRTIIDIPINTAGVYAVLYEGRPVQETYTGTGQPFQIITTGTAEFGTANSDYRVAIDGTPWSEIPDGLWQAGLDEPVFYASTTQDGRLELLFGNSVYGKVPPPTGPNNIAIDYFITQGAVANNAVSALSVASLYNTAIAGVTTTSISQGQDTHDLSFYRYTTPRLFGSGRRMVTREDGKVVILQYPAVVVRDATVVGEHELGPGQARFQNVAGIVLLTDTPMTVPQQSDFLTWLDNYKMTALKTLFIEPTAIPIDVHLDIIIDNNFTGTDVTSAISAHINAFFALTIGTLGRSVYLSDLYKLVMETPGVIHCNVNDPTINLFSDYKSYISLNSVAFDSVTYPDGSLITDNITGISVVAGRILAAPGISYPIPLGVNALDTLVGGDGGDGGDSYDTGTELHTGGGGQAGAVKRHSIPLVATTSYSFVFTRSGVGGSVFTLSPGGLTFTAASGQSGFPGTPLAPGAGGGGGLASGPTTMSQGGTNVLSPTNVIGPGRGGGGSITPTNNVPSQQGQLGECIVAWGTATTTSVAYGDYAGGAGFNGGIV